MVAVAESLPAVLPVHSLTLGSYFEMRSLHSRPLLSSMRSEDLLQQPNGGADGAAERDAAVGDDELPLGPPESLRQGTPRRLPPLDRRLASHSGSFIRLPT